MAPEKQELIPMLLMNQPHLKLYSTGVHVILNRFLDVFRITVQEILKQKKNDVDNIYMISD